MHLATDEALSKDTSIEVKLANVESILHEQLKVTASSNSSRSCLYLHLLSITATYSHLPATSLAAATQWPATGYCSYAYSTTSYSYVQCSSITYPHSHSDLQMIACFWWMTMYSQIRWRCLSEVMLQGHQSLTTVWTCNTATSTYLFHWSLFF